MLSKEEKEALPNSLTKEEGKDTPVAGLADGEK
jgi:hypothetical protein